MSVRDKLFDAILEQRINELDPLVQQLLASRHTYNPDESLLGPFFSSIVLPNNPVQPLWKRLSLTPTRAIAGQQYYDDGGTLRVVNYSELFGPYIHLRAEGTFVASTDMNKQESKKIFPWYDNWKTFSQRKECPDDYFVTVTQVSLHIGTLVWKLPIQGTSTLRVLYGDPDFRIFVSPQNTKSTAGDWEQKGLIVLQVRNDLIHPSRPIDLRNS